MKIKNDTKSKKTGKNRRALTIYPALDPDVNLKSRQDLLDFDYLHKLDEESLKFLNKFIEETVHDSVDRENLSNNLYATTPEKKKLCDDMNNARNRDITTKMKMLEKLDGLDKARHVSYNEENRVHASIDLNIELERQKKLTV